MAVALAAGGLSALIGSRPAVAQPGQERPVPVITAKVTQRSDAQRITVTGSGEARRAAVLRPAAPGVVREIRFEAGDSVEEGAILVRLDDRREHLAVEMAESRVQAARQLLSRYARTRASGAVPDSVVDEARTELRSAQIALAQARETLADRTVNAPFSGRVGIAAVRQGDRVTPETALTTIDDRSVLRVAFSVPERYLDRLTVGQPVTVRNVAYPERDFDGRIAQIDSRVDPVARSVGVLAEVRNEGDRLRPGMSFEVDVDLPGRPAIGVPELALQWDRKGPHVWALRDGRAARVAVRLIRRDEGQVLVKGALEVGDLVVVEGVQRLEEDRRVNIVDGPGPAAPAN